VSERATPGGIRQGLPRRIIDRLFVVVTAVAPGLKPRFQTALIRAAYSILSVALKSDDSPFLNYGYAPLDSNATSIKLDPQDETDRNSIQLYHRVAAARDLRGKQVLEIGCGRGGGASFIARYLEPDSMTGLDLSARAVRYCRRRHPIKGLTFLQGNAEALPVSPNTFDAVINVESSHCYPSFERFIAEVARVLRPNGHFLFADIRAREHVAFASSAALDAPPTIPHWKMTKPFSRSADGSSVGLDATGAPVALDPA